MIVRRFIRPYLSQEHKLCPVQPRGGSVPSSTRSIRAVSPTPTATGSAICPASLPVWIPSPTWVSTRSGSRRTIPRPSSTAATISRITPPSTRSTARWPTSSTCWPKSTAGGCTLSWTSCSTTPRTSTPGSRPPAPAGTIPAAIGTSGPTGAATDHAAKDRRTTGSPCSAAPPGRWTPPRGSTTTTVSSSSSRTSTGAIRRSRLRCSRPSVSGWISAWTASAWTPSTTSLRTPPCAIRALPSPGRTSITRSVPRGMLTSGGACGASATRPCASRPTSPAPIR